MAQILEADGYKEARAPDGLTASAWKSRLKEKYPAPAEGICREVPEELEEQLRLAQEAESYWKNQVSLVKAQIREAMGGAEIATIKGVPFRVRKLIPYEMYFVPAGNRDVLMPPAKDED
jgi:hypothetical protein